MARSYYDILGVPRTADETAIKKAFRKLAHQLHPDRNKSDDDAEKKFKEVNRAYEVLGDADKRKLYDEFGEDAEKLGFDPEKARAYRQWQAGGGVSSEGGVDVEDLLSQLFGGGGGFGGFGARPRASGPPRGRDIQAEMTLDFTTACNGGERVITIDGREVTVRIPAGVRDGGNLRLRGQGLASPRGGKPGDLLLQLRVAPDPDFTRDGDDLRIELPITLGEALRGAHVEVPTLTGAVKVRVPAGAQPGQVLRIRGKGVTPKGRPAGDLLVALKVRLPEVDGHDVDAAITALEGLYDGDVRAGLRRRAA
ncbi:MAG: DnaJ domain-containing protein [Alphaproteobacteria bacterium]|nr:DnaJ domain-containing protein [Alphaproteobacteria bacterium]